MDIEQYTYLKTNNYPLATPKKSSITYFDRCCALKVVKKGFKTSVYHILICDCRYRNEEKSDRKAKTWTCRYHPSTTH